MYVATVGWANSFAENAELDWDVVPPLPVWDADSKPATRLWVNYWAIPKGAKFSQEAFRLVTFLAGAEGQRIVGETAMGIPAVPEIAYGPALPAEKANRLIRDISRCDGRSTAFPTFPSKRSVLRCHDPRI